MKKNQPIRVLIADDQRSVRNGLKVLLTLYAEFEVVALAGSGRQAVQMTKEYRPDLILMDIQMPDMNGIEATRLIKKKWPMIKVIALTMYIGNKEEALAAGADLYLLKGFETEILYQKMLKALSGSVPNSLPLRGRGSYDKRNSSLHQ
jgi:DNA-binding NarL/FixJ family response regulator